MHEARNGCREVLSVLFGPQGTPTAESMVEIRSLLQNNPDLSFLSSVISELPELWSVIVDALPQLSSLPAKERLHDLCQFFRGKGDVPTFSEPINNLLLSPLGVISQAIDFWKLSHGFDKRPAAGSQLEDVQGFCLGFLTATAVSCSKNEADFQSLAAKAVRLALCAGALVDANALDRPEGQDCSATMAVRRKSAVQARCVEDILKSYPRAYISCVTDSRTVTVTIPESDLAAFTADLAKQNVPSMLLPPRGRWHVHENLEGLHQISALCDRDERFRLPAADALQSALLSNTTGQPITRGALHQIVLHSILADQSRWDLMFDSLFAAKGQNRFINIGETVNVPRATATATATATQDNNDKDPENRAGTQSVPRSLDYEDVDLIPESAIAVIGMACRYPDADSIEEFWDLISAGRCVVRQMPEDRFKPSDLVREPKGPFWGGYVRRLDLFDHRFFGISGREAKSMDPQQRLGLQVAYEAMESAGYYGLHADGFDEEVGCYLGSANDDYFDNVCSHPVSAFSLTGTLRSFISGRVSHCLGWTGPSMVMDTACSAAMVAIHTACQAIQTNDCSIAVAGGTCSMSSSRMTQNLIGAGFLSPTGPSKAFDVDANGYCRAEGAGVVVLKSLREAVRNGDFVLGVITGSAVNQGRNDSAIIVPDGSSQSSLYRKALRRSNTVPEDVTYIEAHGTGTQVGDPIEFKSIREIFGSPRRKDDVYVGSVKDNIGHTEASSGVASLIKTLLMFQHQLIPKLANFKQLNPKIEPLGNDHVLIPTQSRKWKASKRIALINNYGAGGNNAALVVEDRVVSPKILTRLSHYPIFISGKTPEAARSYADILRSSLNGKELADVAYNLSIKQNRDFENALIFTSSSVQELTDQLVQSISDDRTHKIPIQKPSVVLCFGGQDGRKAHISRTLYDNSVLLQRHIAECEAVLTEKLSLPSLFPVIFDPAPIDSVTTLHCVLFTIQYACAKSWLDSGLQVDRLIGHSFGQLTALCIAGSLSLVDTLRLISGRAKLVEKYCGSENGVMMVIEGDKSDVNHILDLTQKQSPHYAVDTACYNGPRSLVVAGDKASIQAIEETAATQSVSLRFKRLENSHAFHSRVLDPILSDFLQEAGELPFQTPKIPIEACSKDDNWSEISAEKIVCHTRYPVYFMEAVQRIEKDVNGPIIWLEAGSGSPIVPMARKATASTHQHTYIPTALQNTDASANLSKSVNILWSNGIKAQYWPFHKSQHTCYNWVTMPPYQFAKTSHWIEYRPRASVVEEPPTTFTVVNPNPALVSMLPNQSTPGETLFEINPNHELYQLNTKGHEVVDQTLVPASLYNEFVLTASHMLSNAETGYVPHISNLAMLSPLVVNPVGRVLLRLVENTNPLTHGTGCITISNPSIPISIGYFQALQGLMLRRCEEIENSPSAIGFKGPTAYQAMRRVVTYLDYYHGIQKIYNEGNEATARITLPPVRPKGMGVGFCDPVLVDSFTQVSGILANCFSLPEDGEMWVCNYISDVIFTQQFVESAREENKAWTAYSKFEIPTPKRLKCNIFAFDAETGDIVLTIMSIEFQKVSIKSLRKVLGKLNNQQTPATKHPISTAPRNSMLVKSNPKTPTSWRPEVNSTDSTSVFPDASPNLQTQLFNNTAEKTESSGGALQRVREMLKEILEIPIEEIKTNSALEDLGVDSLLATELFSEINKRFGLSVSHSSFATISNVRELSQLIPGNNNNSDSNISSTPVLTPQFSPVPTAVSHQLPDVPQHQLQVAHAPLDRVKNMLVEVIEIPANEITPNSLLEDLGVDSLLATELFSEVNKRFGIPISHEEFATINDVQGLARLVSGSNLPQVTSSASQSARSTTSKQATYLNKADVETVVFAERDGIHLSADIYYPQMRFETQKSLPIALMIHGGGHVISTRKDIRDDQTEILLNNGFLPVSVDYRLCPEATIHEGAMQDICQAFCWARTTLPTLPLSRSDIRPDGERVVAVGWSSGGHLAISLGFTVPPLGIRPPEAILGFYSPTDYEDPFWASPNLPFDQKPTPPPETGYNFLYDGLHDKPIIGYTPQASKRALGGWMSLEDPRCRIILHMNWEGKSLPVLINGLRRNGVKSVTNPSFPSVEQIQAISPLAQIRAGNYKTPTFFIHGTRDDLVPWQASQRSHEALCEKGVPSGLVILKDALHLFDLYPSSKRNPDAVNGVKQGYEFLKSYVQSH